MSDPIEYVRALRPDETIDPELLERERRNLMANIQSNAPQTLTGLPDGPHVLPQIPYADLEAAVEWLTRAFGFKEAEGARVKGGDSLLHTEVLVGNARIMLGGQGGHGVTSPRDGGNASMFLCVYVEDLDAHFRQARESGATILAEPVDKFFGDRVYECTDLDGHRWSFHQRTGRTWEFSED